MHLTALELYHTIIALDYHLSHGHLASEHFVNTETALKRTLKKMIREYVGMGLLVGYLHLDTDAGSDYSDRLLKEKRNGNQEN